MENNLSDKKTVAGEESETREQDAPVEEAQIEESVAEDQPEVSERETTVERIAAKRAEERAQRVQEQESAPKEGVEEEVAEEIEKEPEPIEEEPEEVQPEESQEDLVELVINGQKQMVPRSELIEAGTRTLQKESAADLRMQNVAIREKELTQREQELNNLLQEYSAINDDFDADKWQADFKDALVDDEDKAAEMMGTMLKKMQAQNLQISRMATTAAQQTANLTKDKRTEEITKMNNLFKKEFPDLAKDPMLKQKANQATALIRRKYPDMSKEEVVKAAGIAVRNYYQNIFGVPAQQPDTKQTPTDIKRKMPPPIKKSSARVPGKREEAPKTRSQIIAEKQAERRQHDP